MPTPLLLSTWSFGLPANRAGLPFLLAASPDAPLDAVEHAAIHAELDLACDSVGIGGLPDASGTVTLDACIMLSPARSAGVAAVRGHAHVASLARKVMELTDHKLLVGPGAEAFAAKLGFPLVDLLTPETRAVWHRWIDLPADQRQALRDKAYAANREDALRPEGPAAAAATSPHREGGHDTIGILALDARGTLAGACTTSGRPFKLPGRVGDSPILGQGLYVDPAAGAATATGNGELMMGTCASFLAVERMRLGDAPVDALRHVLERIAGSYDLKGDEQAALIALHPDGRHAAASLRPGFKFAVTTADAEDLREPTFVLLPE